MKTRFPSHRGRHPWYSKGVMVMQRTHRVSAWLRAGAPAGVALLSLLVVNASAGTLDQDFESWPLTSNWSTTTDVDGWEMHNAQVLNSRGSFAPPIGNVCGWLHDFDSSTNSFLASPLLPNGIRSLSFSCRRPAGASMPPGRLDPAPPAAYHF